MLTFFIWRQCNDFTGFLQQVSCTRYQRIHGLTWIIVFASPRRAYFIYRLLKIHIYAWALKGNYLHSRKSIEIDTVSKNKCSIFGQSVKTRTRSKLIRFESTVVD